MLWIVGQSHADLVQRPVTSRQSVSANALHASDSTAFSSASSPRLPLLPVAVFAACEGAHPASPEREMALSRRSNSLGLHIRPLFQPHPVRLRLVQAASSGCSFRPV
jgi:hypothetical protein